MMARRLFAAFVLGCVAWRCQFFFPTVVASNDAATNGPHLVTKNLYGAPSGAFTIAVDAPSSPSLTLRFENQAHMITFSEPVPTSGVIALPPTPGWYRVMLEDDATHVRSYGQASVTNPATTFTSIQQGVTSGFGAWGNVWPNASMAIGDIDGDTHPDLVLASGLDQNNALTGEGVYPYTWQPGTSKLVAQTATPLTGRFICGVALADMDADGDPDIVFADQRNATSQFDVCVMSNDGTGTFAAPVCATDTGTTKNHVICLGGIAVADFDRDGLPDVAVAGGSQNDTTTTSLTAEVRLFHNTSSGLVESVAYSTSGDAFQSLTLGDMNDDGLIDLVTYGQTPAKLHVLLATGDLTFAAPIDYAPAHGAFNYDQVVVAYMNADTTPDAFVIHPDGPSSLFMSDAQRNLVATQVPTFVPEMQAARFVTFDLDVDGQLDVVMPYKNRLLGADAGAPGPAGAFRTTVAASTTQGTPAPSNSIVGAKQYTSWGEASFAFADFDGDGTIDALYFSPYNSTFEVLKGQ
jgi:hypothetical protein